MTSKVKHDKYEVYKEKVINLLVTNRTGKYGVWKRKNKTISKKHILPLEGEKNNAYTRAQAIEKHLHFDCKPYFPHRKLGLHQYAHHLNSSQLLCLMFFSKLIKNNVATEKMVEFMKNAFTIDIQVGAKCDFEYTQKWDPYIFSVNGKEEYEGTTFDFHINDGCVEVFFEIKFTENGFGKAKKDDDGRHECKATKYADLLPMNIKDNVTSKEILRHYQIFRNLIRASDNNKYVIFITDENNISTYKDKKEFLEVYSKDLDLNHVIFKTWQNMIENYPFELPFQLKAIQNYK